MTFFNEAAINEMLKKQKISQYELSNYYTDNEKAIEQKLSSIFDYSRVEDIEYLYLLLELKYPDSYEKIFEYFYKSQGYIIDDFKIENKESKKMDILALLTYDNDFYANAINWCAFTKFEMETVGSRSSIKRKYQFPSFVRYGLQLTASNDKSAIKIINKELVIENYGKFRVTGHEENSVKITTFQFEFFNVEEKINVEITYKVDGQESIINLKSKDLKEGKTKLRKHIENLDYEKGFFVNLSIIDDD